MCAFDDDALLLSYRDDVQFVVPMPFPGHVSDRQDRCMCYPPRCPSVVTVKSCGLGQCGSSRTLNWNMTPEVTYWSDPPLPTRSQARSCMRLWWYVGLATFTWLCGCSLRRCYPSDGSRGMVTYFQTYKNDVTRLIVGYMGPLPAVPCGLVVRAPHTSLSHPPLPASDRLSTGRHHLIEVALGNWPSRRTY